MEERRKAPLLLQDYDSQNPHVHLQHSLKFNCTLRTVKMYAFMCISFSLTWLSIFATVVTQTCYFPDGSIDSASTPCNGEGSWCCPFGFFCESNLLCGVGIQYLVFTDEAYQRYSCADQTWQSKQCPGVCRGSTPP